MCALRVQNYHKRSKPTNTHSIITQEKKSKELYTCTISLISSYFFISEKKKNTAGCCMFTLLSCWYVYKRGEAKIQFPLIWLTYPPQMLDISSSLWHTYPMVHAFFQCFLILSKLEASDQTERRGGG